MILVREGWFTMGSPGPADEQPRRIWLSSYWIDRTEVSNREYDAFCRATGHPVRERYPALPAVLDRSDHPVVGVTWANSADFATWAGKRLPTEAEWEKAARGADARRYPWGNELPSGGPPANYRDHSYRPISEGDEIGVPLALFERSDGFALTAPVTAFPGGRSPCGALNMLGNVAEWCGDWYAPRAARTGGDRDPRGPPTGEYKVLRGGSYATLAAELSCSGRGDRHRAGYRSPFVGFRCVRSAR